MGLGHNVKMRMKKSKKCKVTPPTIKHTRVKVNIYDWSKFQADTIIESLLNIPSQQNQVE